MRSLLTKDVEVRGAIEPLLRGEHEGCGAGDAGGESNQLHVQQRVARALAIDSDQEARFLQVLRQGFVPGRRISSAAGTGNGAMLIDCFVQPIEDTLTGKINGLPGIMEALGEAAETIRHGARIGIDFSRLRPKGAKVNGSESGAAGPMAYMRVSDRVFDALRICDFPEAAHVAVLRVDHPEHSDRSYCPKAFICAHDPPASWTSSSLNNRYCHRPSARPLLLTVFAQV